MQIGKLSEDDLLQILSIVFCLAGIVLWIIWGRRRIGYAVAPVLFLLHTIIFLVAITVLKLDDGLIVIWANAISLQAVVTIVSAAAIMIYIDRRRARR